MCKHIQAVFRMRDGVVMARAAVMGDYEPEKPGEWRKRLTLSNKFARLENYFELVGNRLEMEADKFGLKFDKCAECILEKREEKSLRREHFHQWLMKIQADAETWGGEPVGESPIFTWGETK